MFMCEECNYIWDSQRSIGDPEVRQCPKCGSYEIEETKASNVAKPNACAQLCEGWRDVRKELPTVDYEVYLVYDKEGSMGLAHYLGGCIFGGWPGVIAWMPLPSPPVFV